MSVIAVAASVAIRLTAMELWDISFWVGRLDFDYCVAQQCNFIDIGIGWTRF